MRSAAVRRYWDALPNWCPCGAQSDHVHHIIHLNGQRITKDDWLVVKLCADCHQHGKQSVHALGGEAQFLAATGWDLVHLAILNRHNHEVRNGR
jgi:hypothetical protein